MYKNMYKKLNCPIEIRQLSFGTGQLY